MSYVSTQPLLVNQTTAGFQIATDLIVTSSGGFEIDWSTEGSGPGPAAYTPSYRLFDANGLPITNEVDGAVITGAYNAPLQLHDSIQLADGTILKALQVRGSSLATTLVLQPFDQAGNAVGDPIYTTSFGGGGRAGLAQLPDGDIVLVSQLIGTGGPGEVFETVLHNTAGQPPDTTAPVAVDFFPAPGSNTLPSDWNIGITFNETVKAGNGVFTLETASGQVVDVIAAFHAQFLGSTMIINPVADLQPGTTYKLIVAPDAVTDLAGNPYAGESDYTFTTASSAPPPPASGDTTAPTAVNVFPAAGSNTLPPDWNLGITFSEAVKAGAGTITLETASGQMLQTFAAASDAGIQFIGSSLVINPAADLQPGTTYKLVVAPDAVTDLAGNAYAGLSGYTFTTAGSAPPPPSGDTTAPTAIDFFPAAGSNTLPADWNLGITFNEAVKAGVGTITLETAAGQVVQTFAAATDPGIQFIGSSVVVNPTADLQPGTTYKLVVAPDAVLDLAGNAYAGENDYTFTVALVGVQPA